MNWLTHVLNACADISASNVGIMTYFVELHRDCVQYMSCNWDRKDVHSLEACPDDQIISQLNTESLFLIFNCSHTEQKFPHLQQNFLMEKVKLAQTLWLRIQKLSLKKLLLLLGFNIFLNLNTIHSKFAWKMQDNHGMKQVGLYAHRLIVPMKYL